jgi:hypothetical protein
MWLGAVAQAESASDTPTITIRLKRHRNIREGLGGKDKGSLAGGVNHGGWRPKNAGVDIPTRDVACVCMRFGRMPLRLKSRRVAAYF